MNTDEMITLFREARPDTPSYDRIAKARLRVRLLNETSEPARHTSPINRRLLLTAGALTGAVAAAGIVVVAQGGGSTRSGDAGPVALRPVANAQDLADNAALVAASEPIVKAGPTQWAYLRTVFAQTQEGGGQPLFGFPKKTATEEKWRRTDDKQFAVIQGGRLQVVDGSKSIPNSVTRMDYPYLLSLPTQPAALLARVYKTVEAEYAASLAAVNKPIPPNALKQTRKKYELAKKFKPTPPTAEQRNARAFELITLYMRDAVLPPKIQAALYGAAAKIPGVRYEAKATDIAKRPGVTLYRIESGYLRNEIVINPKTYGYMGFHIVAIKDHREAGLLPVKQGQIIGWGGLTKATFVNKPGERS